MQPKLTSLCAALISLLTHYYLENSNHNSPRIKLDPNRAIDEAAQGDPTAEGVYNDYHFYLEQAKQIVGRGILFDLHGQAHGQNSTEMGYLLLPEELVRAEIKLIFT